MKENWLFRDDRSVTLVGDQTVYFKESIKNSLFFRAKFVNSTAL